VNAETLLQAFIALVGIVLSLGLFDLKHKLSSLGKLDNIDGILKDLEELVNKMQSVVTNQQVMETSFRLEIQYLKDRLAMLESRVDGIHQSRKD
jgi:uncharacterized protein YqgV (UPF0045/DUF77 family)